MDVLLQQRPPGATASPCPASAPYHKGIAGRIQLLIVVTAALPGHLPHLTGTGLGVNQGSDGRIAAQLLQVIELPRAPQDPPEGTLHLALGPHSHVLACDEDWCRILSQSLVLLLWAGHSGSGSSCHPWLVSQARSAVGWSGSCVRS
jgi:hypothetical protein